MKKLLCFVIILLFTIPVSLFAQDTLEVQPTPPGNLNDVLNADTLSNGQRAHKVYKLGRGFIYQITAPMEINGSFTIVSPGDPNTRPAVIAFAILSDGSNADHFFDVVGKGAKVELDSIYITSFRSDQAEGGWIDGFRLNADSVKFTLNNCIFDGISHTSIALSGFWNKITVENCVFRNEQHATSFFSGGAFLSNNSVCEDTSIFRNNTFFCNNAYLWGPRGYTPYALLDHNTFVYGNVNPFLMRQGQNMHITNNVFYAMHAFGGTPPWFVDGYGSFLSFPDTGSSSVIRLRTRDSTSMWAELAKNFSIITGPEFYVDPAHGVTADMLAPDKRVFELQNNAYYWPTKLTDFYKTYNDTVVSADSVNAPDPNSSSGVTLKLLKRKIYPATFINAYTQYTIGILPSLGATVTVANNDSVDPGFNTDINNQVDKLIAYVNKCASNHLDSTWRYSPSGTYYPPAWPLPENLRYTNAALINGGTDGKALGDLNWFPEQGLVGVNDVNNLPIHFALNQNYPNPFNPSTKISFNLDKSGFANLTIYNILGQKVATLISGNLSAGVHEVNFNASSLSSGIYMYKLESGSNVAIKKMMLLK